MGELNITFGPMYSGKSTELLRVYNKLKKKCEILVINHKNDNRYGETHNVYTHNNQKLNCISFEKLNEYHKLFMDEYKETVNVILIDEAQFFEDLYEFCKYMVDEKKMIVYVFGLSGDFERNKFGQILDLIPISNNVTYLKSICHCCEKVKDAPFTMRKTSNKEQVSVGGSEEYIAVCRECWLNRKN